MNNKKVLTISAVESFTGGLFASEIVSIPGASKYFKGSLVAYSNEIKEKLGIDTSNGVLNEKVSLELAKKGREFFNTDVCVSFVGNAGPSAIENKPVGFTYITINDETYQMNFNGISRNDVRSSAVLFAINQLTKKGYLR